MKSEQPLLPFKSLDDIRLRKEYLRRELRKDNQSMKTQWNGLFHKQENNLPSQRFSNLMTTGVSVFDGLLLAWKLYNRFGGGSKNKRSKNKGNLLTALLFRNRK